MQTATAFKVGKLIDGNGGPVVKDAVIVIEGQRIKAAGAASAVPFLRRDSRRGDRRSPPFPA